MYVPNGAGVFDSVTISSDKTFSSGGSATTKAFIYYATHDDSLKYGTIAESVSGSSFSITDGYWYDTTNNVINRIIRSEILYSGLSFPIAIVSITNGVITSIDQTFNGLGYIGSTAFALPGIKGLIPNGRNADGTLKNIEYVNDSVKTTTTNYTISNGLVALNKIGVHEISTVLWNYNEEKNIFENSLGQISQHFVVASASYNNGIVSNFQLKTTFHAVDYSEVKSVVFPHQTGNAGKALLTDGENTYWGDSTNQPVTALTYSSTVSLLTNNIYTITLSGNVTFSLPQATTGILNQIEVQLYMPSVYTINLGTTTYFGGEAPDISKAGYYTIIYEYDNIRSVWVVGSLKKASV